MHVMQLHCNNIPCLSDTNFRESFDTDDGVRPKFSETLHRELAMFAWASSWQYIQCVEPINHAHVTKLMIFLLHAELIITWARS